MHAGINDRRKEEASEKGSVGTTNEKESEGEGKERRDGRIGRVGLR